MKIQLNTDHNIKGREKLAKEIHSVLEIDMGRFENQITRIEVHLSDTNGPKNGPANKRCLLEARLKGLRPIAVSHTADTLLQAINGASQKLKRSLESTLGELGRNRNVSLDPMASVWSMPDSESA